MTTKPTTTRVKKEPKMIAVKVELDECDENSVLTGKKVNVLQQQPKPKRVISDEQKAKMKESYKTNPWSIAVDTIWKQLQEENASKGTKFTYKNAMSLAKDNYTKIERKPKSSVATQPTTV